MAQPPRDTQTDIRAAVDAISSHFSADAPSSTNNALDTYLNFSDTHRGSNHMLLGVIVFFLLISVVWGFLWYQSLRQANITDSFQFDALSDSTDDLSTLFNDITETSDTEASIEKEITLKKDLANALRKEYSGAAALRTTTTTPTITE